MLRSLIRQGLRTGLSRGLLGGNRAWIAVGGLSLLGHLAGRSLGKGAEVVFSEPLMPGESFRITHLPRG